nr:hypothetical protein [Tanacetum cinerariifolium]
FASEVKKKKSCSNNGGNKNFKVVLVKPKTQYRHEAKQSTEGAIRKTTSSIGKKNVSTSGNGTFSLCNSFETLNAKNTVIEEVETVEYSGDQGSEDEVEFVDNEMTSYVAPKPSGLDMELRACWNNEGKHM